MLKGRKADLNIKNCIETHGKMTLIVLVEYMEEDLLENGSGEWNQIELREVFPVTHQI